MQMRRMRLIVLVVLAAGWFMLPGQAAEGEKKEKKRQANFVHVVILHLKKDAPSGEVDEAIKDARAMLTKIPSVHGLKVGKPSDKYTPTFAKTDYQIGMIVLFEDAEGLKTYLEHPDHLKFVEKHGKFFDMEQLKVYDFADEQK